MAGYMQSPGQKHGYTSVCRTGPPNGYRSSYGQHPVTRALTSLDLSRPLFCGSQANRVTLEYRDTNGGMGQECVGFESDRANRKGEIA